MSETKDAPVTEPGYSPPTIPHVGVTKTPRNEVVPNQYDADGNPVLKGDEATIEPQSAEESTDYEAMTIPELRELAEERGVQVRSDSNKAEIIRALKRG